MQVKEILEKKRDGHALTAQELTFLLDGYLRGEVQDYQMAAWLMAVFLRGCAPEETAELTRLMWKSGTSFPRASQEDYWIDKHSTGGVGDKTSLILVPLVVAVCQRLFGAGKVRLPMVSGRGLGFSGGTLDKLEAVPGFSPSISMAKALSLIDSQDFFMMGQTEDLAPLDRKLYALRDVTATVECLPLIVSSIMSKKLSESPNGLVFDVKVGRGAFMKTEKEARALAEALLAVAQMRGIDGAAVLSRMDEPTGWKAGNFLEVEECADFLSGKVREPGLSKVTLHLAGWMIHLGSRKRLSVEAAIAECEKELEGDKPFLLYQKMFASQGGHWSSFLRQRETFSKEVKTFVARAPAKGFVARLEAKAFGLLINALGGGRNRKEDTIDPLVGIEFLAKCGTAVNAGDPVFHVYYREEAQLPLIEAALATAWTVQATAVSVPSPLVDILEVSPS